MTLFMLDCRKNGDYACAWGNLECNAAGIMLNAGGNGIIYAWGNLGYKGEEVMFCA